MQTPIQTTLSQAVQQATSGNSALSGQARAPALPPSLTQALANGGALAGQVTGRPAAGQVTVQTSVGTVQLQTALPLPQNANVTLQLLSAGPPATLQVQTQPQGQQGAAAGGQAGGAQVGASAAGGAGAGPAVVTSLTQGTVVQATVVSQATSASGSGPTGPGTPQSSAGGQTAAARTTGGTAAQPSAASALPAGTATAIPPNSSLPIRILALALPGQGGLTNTSGGDGGRAALNGTVISGGGGGQTLVQTPAGTLSLATSQPLPPGTQLLFEPAGAARPAADAGAAFNIQRWEGLKEAMTLLQQGNPAAAQQILQSVIPQPGPQMGAAMLFFMSALRGGGMERLFGGDGAKTIDRAGGRAALAKADGDLSSAVGKARDSGGGEWRAYNLPMQQNGALETLRLYVRGDREEAEGEDGKPGRVPAQRFVIEANFSRLGPFQFDGLARDKQIDLMVRTHTPLPDGMRDDIRALFADTTSALGLSGRADFHVVKKFDVVFEESAAPGGVLV